MKSIIAGSGYIVIGMYEIDCVIDIENEAKIEDAIYMLVSCSAFVNYLIAKYEDKKD